jgi:hypothetical protein
MIESFYIAIKLVLLCIALLLLGWSLIAAAIQPFILLDARSFKDIIVVYAHSIPLVVFFAVSLNSSFIADIQPIQIILSLYILWQGASLIFLWSIVPEIIARNKLKQ